MNTRRAELQASAGLTFAIFMALMWGVGSPDTPPADVPAAAVPSEPHRQVCPPDAWDSFDKLNVELPVRQGETWKAECVAVEVESLIGELPAHQFTVESRTEYGVWYVFEWEVLKDA